MASVWLTGCFHEDGLADTIDGFGGGWGRVQILRIMKDSRVGTYGCIGSVLALIMKVHALTLLGERGAAAPALLLGHSLARWVSLPLLYFSHYIQVSSADAHTALLCKSAALLCRGCLLPLSCSKCDLCGLCSRLCIACSASYLQLASSHVWDRNTCITSIVGLQSCARLVQGTPMVMIMACG